MNNILTYEALLQSHNNYDDYFIWLKRKPDEDFWLLCSEKNTKQSFNQYLMKFPQGMYTTQAKAKLELFLKEELLELEKQKAIEEEIRREEERKADHEAFGFAQKDDTPASYKIYMVRYPKGLHFQEAHERTQILIEAQRLKDHYEHELKEQLKRVKNIEADHEAFQKAKQTHTKNAYHIYISIYTQGLHVKEAQELIDAIERAEQEAIKAEEALKKINDDHRAFNLAKKVHTLVSYKSYLHLYPEGLHSHESHQALEHLEKLEEEAKKELEESQKTKKPELGYVEKPIIDFEGNPIGAFQKSILASLHYPQDIGNIIAYEPFRPLKDDKELVVVRFIFSIGFLSGGYAIWFNSIGITSYFDDVSGMIVGVIFMLVGSSTFLPMIRLFLITEHYLIGTYGMAKLDTILEKRIFPSKEDYILYKDIVNLHTHYEKFFIIEFATKKVTIPKKCIFIFQENNILQNFDFKKIG